MAVVSEVKSTSVSMALDDSVCVFSMSSELKRDGLIRSGEYDENKKAEYRHKSS